MKMAQTNYSRTASPVCVVHEATTVTRSALFDDTGVVRLDFPDNAHHKQPDTTRKRRKRVRLTDARPICIPGRILSSEEDVRELWLTKSELRRNCWNAKQDIANARRLESDYLQAVLKTFQLCTAKKTSLSQLFQEKIVQRMLQGSTDDIHSIRGLEYKAAHKALSEYRRLHVQNLLQVQEKSGGSASWEMLQSVSVKTSRPCRSLARLLGHMDELQLQRLLHHEAATTLEQQQDSFGSRRDN